MDHPAISNLVSDSDSAADSDLDLDAHYDLASSTAHTALFPGESDNPTMYLQYQQRILMSHSNNLAPTPNYQQPDSTRHGDYPLSYSDSYDDSTHDGNSLSEESQDEYEREHRNMLRKRSGLGRQRPKKVKSGASQRKRQSGGRKRRNDPNLDPSVQMHLRKAQELYFVNDIDGAMLACQQALHVEPKADAVYRLMGVLLEANGDLVRAMRVYLIMAHLVPKDYKTLRKVAVVARYFGGSDQEMIHCYRKAASADPKDLIVPWKLISLYQARGLVAREIEMYKHLLRALPFNMLLVRDLARMYVVHDGESRKLAHSSGKAAAAQLYMDALTYHANRKFKHPWVVPSEQEMAENVMPGSDPIMERIHFRRVAAKPNQYAITSYTGAFAFDDLIDAARLLLDLKRFSDLATVVHVVIQYFPSLMSGSDNLLTNISILPSRNQPAFSGSGEFPAVVLGNDSVDRMEIDMPSLFHANEIADVVDERVPLEFRVILGVCQLYQDIPPGPNNAVDQLISRGWTYDSHALFELIWSAYMDLCQWERASDVLAISILGAKQCVSVPAELMAMHMPEDSPTDDPAVVEACQEAAATEWTMTQHSLLGVMHYKRGLCFGQMATDHAQIQAIAEHETAIEHDPGALDTYEELARLYRVTGRLDMSIQMLTIAEGLMRDPAAGADSVLYRPRGRSCRSSGGSIRQNIVGQSKGSLNDPTHPTNSGQVSKNGSGSGSLIPDRYNSVDAEKRRNLMLRSKSRKQALSLKSREVRLQFTKMDLVGEGFESMDGDMRDEYLATAKSIFETFCSTAVFFPSERQVTFAGADATGRLHNTPISRARFVEEEEYVLVERRMMLAPRARYDPNDLESMAQQDKLMLQAKFYLGQSMDDWFTQLIRYCAALAKDSKFDEAFAVLDEVADANVFWHDAEKVEYMHVIALSLAIVGKRPKVAVMHARWFIYHYPYSSNAYRIYNAALSTGFLERMEYFSANCQRFLRRTLEYRFSGTLRKHITPEEVDKYGNSANLPVSRDIEEIWTAKPLLLTLYGHLLTCSRNYIFASSFYIRAYALSPKDPMINFSLGVSFLHRAMQRCGVNRHKYVAQGLAFLFRYAEFTDHPAVLCLFNLGRAFHQIGLLPIAVKMYKQALESAVGSSAPSGNGFRLHERPRLPGGQQYIPYVAYNLMLVYLNSGSYELAYSIMNQYLTY